jgi:hypothetical protein
MRNRSLPIIIIIGGKRAWTRTRRIAAGEMVAQPIIPIRARMVQNQELLSAPSLSYVT